MNDCRSARLDALVVPAVYTTMLSAVAPILLALSAAARLTPPRPLPPLPPREEGLVSFAAQSTAGYFKQLIDHTNPSSGTFTQRYWVDSTFYQEGGPIILMTPGEEAADGMHDSRLRWRPS